MKCQNEMLSLINEGEIFLFKLACSECQFEYEKIYTDGGCAYFYLSLYHFCKDTLSYKPCSLIQVHSSRATIIKQDSVRPPLPLINEGRTILGKS